MQIAGAFFIAAGLALGQTVWFAPIVPEAWNNQIGSVDYLDLFQPGAPWTNAQSHVEIFKMYTQMLLPSVAGSFSDAQLQQIFSFLASHHIALALEFGPLTPSAQCGASVEGFAGEVALDVATRIRQLGGTLQYIAMDEPMYFGSLYSGPNACHWTPQQVAVNAVQNIAQIKTVFPNLIVGDIEPTPGTGASADWLNQYAVWVDAWKAAAGAELPFFHFDVNWTLDWRPSLERMREVLHRRGIPFGIIYNGWNSDTTDASWIDDSVSHYAEWEGQGGSTPDHVIFQSWQANPTHVLPETDPTAFTYLIDSYFRERTRLSLLATGSEAGGRLVSAGGPVTGATVTVTAQAISGPGTVATYTMTGTVPAGITTGVIQTCVNECGEVASADIGVYGFAYQDSGGIWNFGFSQGLTGWGVDGTGTATVQASGDGSIEITSTGQQHTFVNSSPITVVPGSSFTLTIQARVSPSSIDSGYFAMVFLQASGVELTRTTLPFAPATITLGAAPTAADGSYRVAFPSPVEGMQIKAFYPGNGTLWPAFAGGPPSKPPF